MNNWDLIESNELSKNANGGTELMLRRIYDGFIPRELLEQFQIIPSRVQNLNTEKFRILFINDLLGDPGIDQYLKDDGWRNYHRLVFVSHWQAQRFIEHYNIPWSKTTVLLNAITPIESHEKPKDKIGLIYHTTPHRGLNILVTIFDRILKENPDTNIELNVYSSFKLYGWEERDKAYQDIYDYCEKHPKINYYGAVSNDEVREALKQNHIFAYPSIWQETSCLSLMEAMSAQLLCVHPNYGALPETAANWTVMYPWHEDINMHAGIFFNALNNTIKQYTNNSSFKHLEPQKFYADSFYNWDYRKLQWKAILEQIVEMNPSKELPQEEFVYRV